MHHMIVANICTATMEKVMNSWERGDTKFGRAADIEANRNILKILFVLVRSAPYTTENPNPTPNR